MSDSDARWLYRYGVRVAFDLRTPREIARDGDFRTLIENGVEYINSPLDARSPLPLLPTPSDYALQYSELLVPALPVVRSILLALVSGNCAVMVGCTAGKDRTGVVAATLLALLGAQHEGIVADFVESGAGLAPFIERFESRWREKGISRCQYEQRFRPQRGAIEPFLSELNALSKSAGADCAAFGLDEALLRRAREQLLEPEGI